jgi:hypothetical protein
MATTPKFQKGDHVHYGLGKFGKGRKVAAIVRRAHRDGTVTVEARFFVNSAGAREVGYLGYRYRYEASLLKAA